MSDRFDFRETILIYMAHNQRIPDLDPDGQRGMWLAHTRRIPSFKGRLLPRRIPGAYPKRLLARVIRIRGEKSVWRIPCAYVFLDSYQHSGRTGSPAHCARIVVHIPRRIFDMVHPEEFGS